MLRRLHLLYRGHEYVFVFVFVSLFVFVFVFETASIVCTAVLLHTEHMNILPWAPHTPPHISPHYNLHQHGGARESLIK